MNKPILILALPKHDDDFTSTPYQLAMEFAISSRVLYVSHPYSWLDLLRNMTDVRLIKRLKASLRGGAVETSKHPNLMLLILPLVLPINWLPSGKLYNWLSKVNHRIVARSINKTTAKLELGRFHFINSHDYYFADMYRQLLGMSQYVYQCIDPIIKQYSARHGKALEERAARSADLVISTSPYLNERMLAYNPNSKLVPNAANFELCNKAMKEETKTLPEITKLNGLKIGYVGNIERRIDYQMLINIFTARPDWHLVMVGPKDESYIPAKFLTLSNLTLLPSVSHEQVPQVLKSIDIAIIPFVCDEVSAQIYPLKMYEYLASGKPVITTNFNPQVIGELQDVVNIASDGIDFIWQVELLNTTDSAELQAQRIEVARANDWSQRSEMILNLI